MPIFLLKTILSFILLFLTFVALFTMFEVLGRSEKKFDIEKLKKAHRVNGIIYLLFYLIIAYFCLNFIVNTRAEPSPRAALHAVFAIAVIAVLAIKILFVTVYKQFYGKAAALGILTAVLTFLMFGTSGGYYLFVADFKTDKIAAHKKDIPVQTAEIPIKTDAGSIRNGRELYESKCFLCHDPESTKTIIGPGHKGILKNPALPSSKRPANPENIALQLRKPYKNMPAFDYLSDSDVQNIIAYMNTL